MPRSPRAWSPACSRARSESTRWAKPRGRAWLATSANGACSTVSTAQQRSRARASEDARRRSERRAFSVRHLFVTQDYGPDLGGMARRHVEICRRLSPDGVTVSTVAAADDGKFDGGESYPIRRQSFGFKQANRTGNRIRWARDLAAMAPDFDIIHAGNIRASGYAAWWAARRARIPYVVYVNGGDLLREKRKAGNLTRRLGARRIFASSSGIVAT